MDSLGTGLITTDTEGRIYLFNRAAEEMSGYRTDDALRLTIWQLFPGMPPKIDSGQFEIPMTRDDGVSAEPPVFGFARHDRRKEHGGLCLEFRGRYRITRRSNGEMRQKEQMAAIGAMSAGIAHEIRNPLASIAGSFKLLQSDLQLSADQSQLIEIITRETDRLNRTISDFLGYARPLSPNRKEADLAELISETVKLMRNSPELKQEHRIETWLRPVRINVDESMMRQVFYNLASNAFKAMPNGGTLTISLEGRDGKTHDPIRRHRGRYWRGGVETVVRSI